MKATVINIRVDNNRKKEIEDKAIEHTIKGKTSDFFWLMYQNFEWIENLAKQYTKGNIEALKYKIEDMLEKG